MDLDTALASRRSFRDYTAEPVDEATIRRLIGAAVLAPSATNAQPWTFTVLRDRALLDRLSTAAKAYVLAGGLPEGPGAERRRARLADPDYQIFHHAPVVILISGTASDAWVVEDCALAAENLMLASIGATGRIDSGSPTSARPTSSSETPISRPEMLKAGRVIPTLQIA